MHHILYDHQIFLTWLSCEKHAILNSSNVFGLFISSFILRHSSSVTFCFSLAFLLSLSCYRVFSCSPVCHLLISPCLFKPVFFSYERPYAGSSVLFSSLSRSCCHPGSPAFLSLSPCPFVLPVFCTCYPWIYGLFSFLFYCLVVWIVFVASFLLPAFLVITFLILDNWTGFQLPEKDGFFVVNLPTSVSAYGSCFCKPDNLILQKKIWIKKSGDMSCTCPGR